MALSGLPNDLLYDLLSHMQPSYPLPKFNWMNVTFDPDQHFALVSLSQTCQSFRVFLLRHAWKRIEVHCGQRVASGHLVTFEQWMKAEPKERRIQSKRFSVEILRQLETAARNPLLAEYVE